ncbi:MAG TPA: anti-sigma factor [Propionibacteriaceae bacterium]
MVHVNSALLAGHALGQDDALDAAEQEHLASCSHCRAELDQYRRVVTLGQGAQASDVPTPPLDRIWRSIQAELAPNSTTEEIAATKTMVADSVPPLTANDKPANDKPASDEPVNDVSANDTSVSDVPANDEPRDVGTAKPTAGRRRKWWPIVAAAAALGLVVGAGATVIINRNDVQVAASIALSALPGQTGHGTAELLRTPNDPELRVSVDGPQPADRYREVWLINSDGQRMYSLGVLPESGTGTYPLPTLLSNGLDGFTIVDVSIEPYDGNPEHSRNSQVRGSLPE